MKLSKSFLIKKTSPKLGDLGYQNVVDSITGANGLFIKSLSNSFFLTLGLEISKYSDSLFTASFYLSKSTMWGTLYGDIPDESYQRISYFLTSKERQKLLEDVANIDNRDVWWNIKHSRCFENFVDAVEITESRFLEQKKLFAKIENSIDVKELHDLSFETIKIIKNGIGLISNFKFIPNKPIDNVSLEWFKAAEMVLGSFKMTTNKNAVRYLAIDAWRQSNYGGNLPNSSIPKQITD